MIDVTQAVRQLSRNAEAIRVLAGALPEEAANWSPAADIWSMKDVAEHLYNEERFDFRRHLKTMFGESPESRQHIELKSAREALDGFLLERAASMAWLRALESPDWGATIELQFGPNERFTFSAGDMLVSWVEHDNLHLRQMVELLHAWHEHVATPYSTKYAGEW